MTTDIDEIDWDRGMVRARTGLGELTNVDATVDPSERDELRHQRS